MGDFQSSIERQQIKTNLKNQKNKDAIC